MSEDRLSSHNHGDCELCEEIEKETEWFKGLASAWYTAARSKGWVRSVFDEKHPLDDDLPGRDEVKRLREALEPFIRDYPVTPRKSGPLPPGYTSDEFDAHCVFCDQGDRRTFTVRPHSKGRRQ